MTTKYQAIPKLLALAGACMLACASGTTAHANNSALISNDLIGTWQVQVALHNCQSGVPIGAPFYSLLTFADGGTMTESTANAMFFPAIRGPGHGVWNEGGFDGFSGVHTYSAASIAFITMNGALVKTQKISQTIVMGPGPDEFTTPQASVQFFDPAGVLLQTGCASAVGTRFEP
jgi:hypothetical protein